MSGVVYVASARKVEPFVGTVALITGASSGIGEATAIRLAEGGARVAVVDLNADAANAVAEKIGGKEWHPARIEGLKDDLRALVLGEIGRWSFSR